MINIVVKSLFSCKGALWLPVGNHKVNSYIKDSKEVKVTLEDTKESMTFKTKKDWVKSHGFTGQKEYRNVHPDYKNIPTYKLAYFKWEPK